MSRKRVVKRSNVLTKEAPGRYDATECPGATVSLALSQRKRADEGTVRRFAAWPRGSRSAGLPRPDAGLRRAGARAPGDGPGSWDFRRRVPEVRRARRSGADG